MARAATVGAAVSVVWVESSDPMGTAPAGMVALAVPTVNPVATAVPVEPTGRPALLAHPDKTIPDD